MHGDDQPSNVQHYHHLVSDFASHDLQHHCNTCMSWDHRQSPQKSLLNTFVTWHMTHTMTRYGNHDTENICATQDSAPLDLVSQDHTIHEGDNESSDKYSKENDTHHPLTKLLEQFWQLQDQFACLKSANHLPTPMAELMQLTDKLQHLTMYDTPTLPAPQPNYKPVQKTMQAYTLCLQHRDGQTSPWPCCRILPHSMDRAPQSWRTGSWTLKLLLTF